MDKKRLKRPAEFILKMLLVYAGWRLFKYLGEANENFLWGGWSSFKDIMGASLSASTAFVLQLLGYNLTHYGRSVIVDGYPGIWIADLCLGIAPMVIFTGFVLVFGNNNRNKLWFIPLGLVLIYLTNVARFVALALVQIHHNDYFKVAHEKIYVTITYGLIFLLLMWWMNSLAFKKESAKA
ncbi:MAG: archaeosortase/exosortase family protein [Chitinophagales bacterium]